MSYILALYYLTSVLGKNEMQKPFCFRFSINRLLGQINIGTDRILRFQNGCNKVVIELRVLQFWSEFILVISNRTRAARASDFKIMRVISDQIALHSVQLPLFIK